MRTPLKTREGIFLPRETVREKDKRQERPRLVLYLFRCVSPSRLKKTGEEAVLAYVHVTGNARQQRPVLVTH
jgi:hypothetical protein